MLFLYSLLWILNAKQQTPTWTIVRFAARLMSDRSRERTIWKKRVQCHESKINQHWKLNRFYLWHFNRKKELGKFRRKKNGNIYVFCCRDIQWMNDSVRTIKLKCAKEKNRTEWKLPMWERLCDDVVQLQFCHLNKTLYLFSHGDCGKRKTAKAQINQTKNPVNISNQYTELKQLFILIHL